MNARPKSGIQPGATINLDRAEGAPHEPKCPTVCSARVRPPPPLVLALVFLCVLAFAPVGWNQFVNWDDDLNFQGNNDFRGLGVRQIEWAWRTQLLGVYQPLGWMIHEVEYVCWGLDPRAYHLVSVVFHIVNALLLFLLTMRVVRIRLPEQAKNHQTSLAVAAALGAALFALHPLRVEVVAWASCQTYLPCVTFYLLSLLAYLNAHTRPARTRLWLALSWVCFFAALLCKAVAVTLPCAMLLLDQFILTPRPRRRWAVVVLRLLYLVPAAVFMVIAVRARSTTMPLSQDGVYSRIACASTSVWFYSIKTVCPCGTDQPLSASRDGRARAPRVSAGHLRVRERRHRIMALGASAGQWAGQLGSATCASLAPVPAWFGRARRSSPTATATCR